MGIATKRLSYHSPVHFWTGDDTRWVYTTIGRVIFNSILPEGIRREGFRNLVMRKRDLSELVFESYRFAGLAARCSSSITSRNSASATPPWAACRSGWRIW